ncbi:hypothetical protein KSP40_PGU006193 [Platanthera guangdongensis]|uniref:Fe-S metabolism associated domain-containing protein n=1 Tax=Platanthera guangdongensis TaxID=2320717 RepID=A0ABR2MF14_9ASPA
MPSSLFSSSLRLLPPELLQNPKNHPLKSFVPMIHKSLFLFRSPISFQRVTGLPSSQPLVAHSHPPHHQQQQSDSGDPSSQDHLTKLLPPALREIVNLFQSVGDSPKAKYQQLLHYGSQLPPLHPRFKDDAHRVRGCVSQVWIRAFPDPADPAAVQFEADSDSALTKGLCALLVFGLSGSPASAIARVPPDFVLLLGLRQTLTPSRNNGFLNMLRLMQKKAQELQRTEEEFDDFDGEEKNNLRTNVNGWRPLDYAAYGKGSTASAGESSVSKDDDGQRFEVGSRDGRIAAGLEDEIDSAQPRLSDRGGGRRERIEKALETALSPAELVVEDISHLHAGHAGIVGRNSGETHFKVRAVSEMFEGKSLVKRHRLVYGLLENELQAGLHSLSIVAMTPSEATRSTST